MIEISDPEDLRVSDFSLLKSKEESDAVFIADHEKTVVRLLKSSLMIKSIFGTEKYITKHKTLLATRVMEENIFYGTRELFEKTIGFPVHQGFMGLGMTPSLDISLEDVPQILLCNSLVDSENMGSIFRTSASFGLSSILLDKRCIHPYLRRTVRVSMGNIFSLSIQRSKDLFKDLTIYKSKGYKIISLSLPGKDSFSYFKIGEFVFPEKFILILGNESEGVSEELKKWTDFFLYIPMYGGVDSLNVSHSLAVCLSFWKRGV
jgi:tRNA G18 (ribose-2'-O)-methylase SpoU